MMSQDDISLVTNNLILSLHKLHVKWDYNMQQFNMHNTTLWTRKKVAVHLWSFITLENLHLIFIIFALL